MTDHATQNHRQEVIRLLQQILAEIKKSNLHLNGIEGK